MAPDDEDEEEDLVAEEDEEELRAASGTVSRTGSGSRSCTLRRIETLAEAWALAFTSSTSSSAPDATSWSTRRIVRRRASWSGAVLALVSKSSSRCLRTTQWSGTRSIASALRPAKSAATDAVAVPAKASTTHVPTGHMQPMNQYIIFRENGHRMRGC